MRTLIIPDIHNHIESADRWIAQFPADQIVFLGDYFDSFDDTEAMAEATAHWLKASISKPNRIHLWGNHDIAYAFPRNRHLRCSGFTEEKLAVLQGILTDKDWAKLSFYHLEGETLFTHAGIDPKVFAHPVTGMTEDRLDSLCREALKQARAGLPDPVLDLRGLLWLRWWDMEVLAEWDQVVGHTPAPKIRIAQASGRLNLCLDSFGHYVGMLEDGALSYIDTRTEKAVSIRAADQ